MKRKMILGGRKRYLSPMNQSRYFFNQIMNESRQKTNSENTQFSASLTISTSFRGLASLNHIQSRYLSLFHLFV